MRHYQSCVSFSGKSETHGRFCNGLLCQKSHLSVMALNCMSACIEWSNENLKNSIQIHFIWTLAFFHPVALANSWQTLS